MTGDLDTRSTQVFIPRRGSQSVPVRIASLHPVNLSRAQSRCEASMRGIADRVAAAVTEHAGHSIEVMRRRLGDARASMRPPFGMWLRRRLHIGWLPSSEALAEPGLLRQGRLVWGAAIWPTRGFEDPSCGDAPMIVAYSLDPWYDEHLGALVDIGRSLCDEILGRPLSTLHRLDGDLKWLHTLPVDRTLEMRSSVNFECKNLELHVKFTDGHDVRVTRAWIRRRSLPLGCLRHRWFPLLVDPPGESLTMVLPWEHWDTRTRELWKRPAKGLGKR